MKITTALACAAVLLALPAPSQENRDDLTPLDIAYALGVSEDRSRLLVEMTIDHVRRPTLHLAMPAWSPGSYGIAHYGDAVMELRAVGDDDRELEVTRMSRGSWSVATAGTTRLRVSYAVPAASRRFGAMRDDAAEVTGRHLSGPSTYMYVMGAKDRPVEVRYRLPEGWRIANGLLPTGDPWTRRARDYDTFIDAPTILGHFEERTFEVNGTPFSCVFFTNSQEYDFDIDAFVDIVRRIVTNIGELFGSYPFPNYVFLFTLPGGGGLEHLNSTSIGLSAAAQRDNPEAGASVTAHEFFHAWNVKRIHPKVLGPFDYQNENYTGNLWVSEGWTSYFGDLTLVRIGVLDREEYLAHLSRVIGNEINKERRKEHSVYWASRNVWHRFPEEEEPRVDYYDKGELLAALIDLEMRHRTGNRKSLNDVMRFMNRWFGERDQGFEEDDVERACTAIGNHDFSEFFARHVYGTLDPPIAECLGHAGIDYREETIPCAFPFPVRGRRVSGRPSAETASDPGPRPGETIRAANGADFTTATAFLREHRPGDSVVLLLERNGETREVTVVLAAESQTVPTLAFRADATEEQLRTRDAWLGSVR